MRTPAASVFAPRATAAAALLMLLSGATGPRPPSAATVEFGLTSEAGGTPHRYATPTGSNSIWSATTATPALVVDASYSCLLLYDLQGPALGSLGVFTLLPDVQTAGVGKTKINPDGRSTINTDRRRRSSGRRRTTTTTNTTTTTTSSTTSSSDQTAVHTSTTATYHDSFIGGDHEETYNNFRWRRFRHEPVPLPDQFMARFLNTLMYLAEVITADVVSAFLFGRWCPHYYQRARKNRLNRRRRKLYRQIRMYAIDVGMMILDACVQLHDKFRLIPDDESKPTYQMVSNVQFTEYPATLSTIADVPTSEVIATVASARSTALVSIASLSAPTSAFDDLPLHAPKPAQAEDTSAELQSAVPSLVPLLLEAPEISRGVSCRPRQSLPDTRLEIAPPPAVSLRLSLRLAAVPPTTGPSISTRQCPPGGGNKEVMFRAGTLLTDVCPLVTAAANGCDVHHTITPMPETSNGEREWLAVLGINLLLEGLASPYAATSAHSRNNRPSLVAAETISGNTEGTVNTLARYQPAERRVPAPVDESYGQADTSDDSHSVPAPFFVSERYTPESTCYVSAHGVAYTTIVMSYVHRFSLPIDREMRGEATTTTQSGDVSDILFPAVNAKMRCKWSRECIQTTSSEYYRSSVEAVFVSRSIPDETDMVVLDNLVTRHL